MRAIISFILGFFAIIVGFYLLIAAAFGSNDLFVVVALVFVIGIAILLGRTLIGKAPSRPSSHDIGFDKANQIQYTTERVKFDKRILQTGYGFALGIMSFSLYACFHLGITYNQWGSMYFFAPLYILNVIGAVLVFIKLYKESQIPEWITENGQTSKPKDSLRSWVNFLMLFTVFIWIWCSFAIPTAARARTEKQRTTAERQAEEDENDRANAEQEAEFKSKIEEQNRQAQAEEDRLAQEIASSTLSTKWASMTVASSPKIGLEYPSKWGNPKVTSDIDSGTRPEDETFMIEFSGSKTPILFIFNGPRSLGKSDGTIWLDVIGYNYKKIEGTEHSLKIQIKESDNTVLCDNQSGSSGCYAGEYAADFNKLSVSTKAK